MNSPTTFNHPATPWTYTLSLHDALPILPPQRHRLPRGRHAGEHHRQDRRGRAGDRRPQPAGGRDRAERSEEHTSELQSPCNLVCRLLLEKKKFSDTTYHTAEF